MANEFIQCRKVCEHVLEKVLNAETTPSGGNANNSLQNSQSDANSEGSQLPAEERIELWCNDVVRQMDKSHLKDLVHRLSFKGCGPQHGPAHGAPLYLEAVDRSNVSVQDQTEFQLRW